MLIAIFKDSYPKARQQVLLTFEGEDKAVATARHLNAGGIKLDKAFLQGADFRYAWLRRATLRKGVLDGVKLTGAVLEMANLAGACLKQAELEGAKLIRANFSGADLTGADCSHARIDYAVFLNANLADFTMIGGTAIGVDFTGADLSGAKFRDVIFGSADGDGKVANLEASAKLTGAEFVGIRGLTSEQISSCEAKGARFPPVSTSSIGTSRAVTRLVSK